MTALLLSLGLGLSLSLAGFCAGAETGFTSLSRGRVLHMARAGSRAAKRLQDAVSAIPRTLTALLVGNNVGSVSFSACSAALAARAFPDSAAAQAVWGFCAATAILYLGEFVPKLVCSARPLRRMLALAGAWRAFSVALSPLATLAMWLTNLFSPSTAKREPVTAQEVLRILRDRKDGVRLTDLESALVARILVNRAKGKPVTPEAIMSAVE